MDEHKIKLEVNRRLEVNSRASEQKRNGSLELFIQNQKSKNNSKCPTS